MVASKARRSAARRSSGTPGGAATGRPGLLPQQDQRQHPLLVRVLHDVERGRRVRQLGKLLASASCTITLSSLSLIQCGRDAFMVDQDRPQMPSTSPRSIDSVRPAAGIVAGDHAEFGAEQRIEHLRHQRGVGGRAGGADDHLALLSPAAMVLIGLCVPGRADALLLADRADPVELERVVARAGSRRTAGPW